MVQQADQLIRKIVFRPGGFEQLLHMRAKDEQTRIEQETPATRLADFRIQW
jgi:hypothetical protein